MSKKLAVFDFDHTIVDDNTDTVVRDLIPKEKIPQSVKILHKSDGWTAYMQGIFDLLHKHKVGPKEIRKTVEGIKATEGMCDLIRELSEQLHYDIIIISDANSYFINTWLKKAGLNKNIRAVFTNPAEFVDGLLKVEMYHLQTECKLSTKNLCKGRILNEFVDGQRAKHIHYKSIVYVGDGMNDFCPILRLKEGDLACVRDKYKCADLVRLAKNGKPDSNGKIYKIKADVLIWKSGFDILQKING